MESFLAGRLPFAVWRGLGGAETLLSYGLDARTCSEAKAHATRISPSACPTITGASSRASARSIAPAAIASFTRACGRASRSRARTSPILPASVYEFLDDDGDFGFIVVHGHTPVERVDFRSNRINLDTGAYVSNRLSVLRMEPPPGAALLAPEAP